MMKFITNKLLLILFVYSISTLGQELVHEFMVDTSLYDMTVERTTGAILFSIIPIPMYITTPPSYYAQINSNPGATTIHYSVLKKKNSNQFDIFSQNGKAGTIILSDALLSLSSDGYSIKVVSSQFYVDDDTGWEYIVNYMDQSEEYQFNLIDENSKVLLSGKGLACFAFDGQDTYIIRPMQANAFSGTIYSSKTWRLRANVSSSTSPGLSKQKNNPNSMMTFGLSGSYRVSLKPSNAGKIEVQLTDLLGRLVYSDILNDISQPTTLTIPAEKLPKSPFITKVKTESTIDVKREIHIR